MRANLAGVSKLWEPEEDAILIKGSNRGLTKFQLRERLPDRSIRSIEYRITLHRASGEITGFVAEPSGHPATEKELDAANEAHVAALLGYYARDGRVPPLMDPVAFVYRCQALGVVVRAPQVAA